MNGERGAKKRDKRKWRIGLGVEVNLSRGGFDTRVMFAVVLKSKDAAVISRVNNDNDRERDDT